MAAEDVTPCQGSVSEFLCAQYSESLLKDPILELITNPRQCSLTAHMDSDFRC